MADATTTTSNRTTTDFDDTFREFRVNLEYEGEDLERSLFNPKIGEQEGSIREQPQAHACRVLFGVDYSDQTDKEFLLAKAPCCLLTSNSSFRTALFSELPHVSNPDVLEQLIVFNYRMSIIDHHKRLWETYLKSGTGQLQTIGPSGQNDPTTTLYYWPPMISHFKRTKEAIEITSDDHMDHERRTDLVKQYLAQLDARHNHYRVQFDAIKSDLSSSSDVLLPDIELFIRKQAPLTVRIYFEAVLSLMKHDYVDRLLQYRYGQQKPTEQQIRLAKRICQVTLTKEKSEKEHYTFQMAVSHTKIPASICFSERHVPSMITTINHPIERARLNDAYIRWINRAQSELTNVLISTSNDIKRASQKHFHDTLAAIWHDQHCLPEHERLSMGMLRLIEQRQTNIADCLRYIYEFKSQFTLHVPPTSTSNM